MKNFAGLPERYSNYDSSKIAILPVAFDDLNAWKQGAKNGPNAILEASSHLEMFDTETRYEVYKSGIHTCAPIEGCESPEAMCERVEQRVGALLDEGKFPVTIGGVHTVSIGAFRAVASRVKDLTILQCDARGNLRTTFEGSELNRACVMNYAQKLAPILQVGIRGMSLEEDKNCDPSRIFYSRDIFFDQSERWHQEALDILTPNVYLTIDLSVFDPSIVPSVSIPEPGGLLYFNALRFIRRLFRSVNVVGFDIVGLYPNPHDTASDFLAARLAYQLMTYKFGHK